MKRVRGIFIFSVIWFFAGLIVATIWAERPTTWAAYYAGVEGGRTIEEAQKAFPIHLAPFRNANIKHHTEQIENEDTALPPAFDPYEWAFRETCYRAITAYTFWLACGFFMNWFLGTIVRGKNTWTG